MGNVLLLWASLAAAIIATGPEPLSLDRLTGCGLEQSWGSGAERRP